MPVYTTSEQFYTTMKALFACIGKGYPRAADAVIASRLLIRMRFTAPTAEVVIDGRSRPLGVSFGPAPALRPDLDIELNADTFHRILLGELSLMKALGSGLLKAKGPIWKAGALGALFEQGKTCYPAILREHGLAHK